MKKQAEEKTPVLFEVNGRAVLTGLERNRHYADYAILTVRDPLGYPTDSADGIAGHMENVREISRNQMFTVLLGTYKGLEVLVCSSGSGGPECEIALLDLLQYGGVKTFLHVGTSGVHVPEIQVGDAIITTGAVRDEGLTSEYIKETFPAVASYELVVSLVEAAQKRNSRYHVGITRSNDSVYVGQGRPIEGYIQPEQAGMVAYWTKAGVLNAERETAATITLSLLFGCRAGAINTACNNTASQHVDPGKGIANVTDIALDALVLLAKKDRQKEKAGQPYWSPALADQ